MTSVRAVLVGLRVATATLCLLLIGNWRWASPPIASSAPEARDSVCPVAGDPPSLGPLYYQGQSGNTFEYQSDAGRDSRFWYYQVKIRNKGAQPLTVEWSKPGYFRRGIPPNTDAAGQCLQDGNSPNEDIDRILYGPNSQFPGPTARFYKPSPSAQNVALPIDIAFDSVLGDTRKVSIRVALASTLMSQTSVSYKFRNAGSPVRIKWKAIQGPEFDKAAIRQLSAAKYSNERGLALASRETTEVSVAAAGIPPRRVLHLIEIWTVDGILIYRDLAPAFTLDDILSYGK